MVLIFLYLALVFLTNALLLTLVRRYGLADFIAYLISGFLIGGMVLAVQAIDSQSDLTRLQPAYQIHEDTRGILQPYLPDSADIQYLDRLERQTFYGEKQFLDSLRFYVDAPLTDSLSMVFMQNAHKSGNSEAYSMILLLALSGLLFFTMKLGANFSPTLLRFNADSRLLLESCMMALTAAAILFAAGFFLLFDGHYLHAVYLSVALLGVNIGAVVTGRFPLHPDVKQPVMRLIQLAAVMDILSIAAFAWLMLFNNYRDGFTAQMIADLPFWFVLLVFIASIAFQGVLEPLFLRVKSWMKEQSTLLRGGFILLFIYSGLHINFPLIVLGLGAGFLFDKMLPGRDDRSRKRFFSGVSILFPLPFVEAGRLAVCSVADLENIALLVSMLLTAFVSIAMVVAVFWLSRKHYPLMMGLGMFPRGEIAILILWLFKIQYLIPGEVYAAAVMATLLSSVAATAASPLVWNTILNDRKR